MMNVETLEKRGACYRYQEVRVPARPPSDRLDGSLSHPLHALSCNLSFHPAVLIVLKLCVHHREL